jgi:predicted metal-binding membrane protein
MMTPSAMPMILMYARLGRYAEPQGTPLVATVWFVAGYFLVWVAFALLATLVQWALERTALLDSWMASTSNILGGLLFVAAGSYQWTRLKDVCLAQCQRPFAFLMRQGGFRRDAPSSLMLGLRHGAYCVGCCWVLMTLLLAGGVMNVLWIALLALLIILEKVTSAAQSLTLLASSSSWPARGCSQWACPNHINAGRLRNVCFWHKADIATVPDDVCFRG